MNRSIVFRIVMALVLIGAIVGLGAYAYHLGLTQGIAQGAQLPSGQTGQAPFAYGWMPYGRPFMGFGLLSCLIPFFLLFLAFAALRGLFWHNHRGWRSFRHGDWGMRHSNGKEGWENEVPQVFSEWHRKAHEPKDKVEPEK